MMQGISKGIRVAHRFRKRELSLFPLNEHRQGDSRSPEPLGWIAGSVDRGSRVIHAKQCTTAVELLLAAASPVAPQGRKQGKRGLG